MNFVYSTMTCDNAYTLYERTAGGLSVPVKEVLIKGGTGLANKYLITPLGVATQVSDEELALLKENPIFQTTNGEWLPCCTGLAVSKKTQKKSLAI